MQNSGYALWRYDKKMALEIILVAHAQQLLHPALITKIEENYSCLYARTFAFILRSEVEMLLTAVKDHIIELYWQDAVGDKGYVQYSMRK